MVNDATKLHRKNLNLAIQALKTEMDAQIEVLAEQFHVSVEKIHDLLFNVSIYKAEREVNKWNAMIFYMRRLKNTGTFFLL